LQTDTRGRQFAFPRRIGQPTGQASIG